MSSWFKGSSSATDKTAKESSKRYENLELAQDKDPFGDVGFFSKGTPVTTSADETANETAQPKRSWKERKPMAMFVDQEGEAPPPKTIGSGDLIGFPSDLDFCCLQDGAIDCLGADTKVVLCEGQDNIDVIYTEKRKFFQGKARSNDNKDADTNETGNSQQLDNIREMGAIRDKKEGKGMAYYLSQCMPDKNSAPEKESEPEKKSSFVTSSKKRLRIFLLTLTLAVAALIAGIVVFTLRRQNKPKNGTDQLVSINDNKRAEEIRNLLTLTPSSDLETEGSPQHLALKWIVDEDPLAISLESDDAIRERFAAATLHFATNGPEKWNESLGFLSNNSICSWNIDSVEESNGIFCQDGRVNQINVVNNNLAGSLPNELNYFSEMVVLNLYYNKLTGVIPDLSYLEKLEQLDVDANALSGTVPESLFNLPSLVNLFLLFNEGLTGRIPEIEDSSKLVAISLLGCSFTGTLPKSLGNLSSLRLLQLKDNNFEGSIPPKLMSLPNLETLGLDGNRLSGSIPPVIINEERTLLTSLSLGSNRLEGDLPYGLDDLIMLEFLDADNNMLTGSIRTAIMDLPNLEQLWLQGNSLTGDVSHFLFESNSLTDVHLGNNDFKGNLHDFLALAPPSLEQLDLSRNGRIDGHISEDIGNFRSMKYFNVSSCSLGGEIPTEIGRMNNLQTLDLSWNDFQGDVPEEMADMKSLTTFDVSRNRDLGGDLSSSVCKEKFDLIFSLADCSGNVRVECDCCTHCCNREGVCGPNNN